ncbi:hypothetical protein RSOLAG1IB_06543 [Rhizoctonia solani AG-1 IB]|uniref:Uncharacterized protein n=1 Tax=Thanatephorus cucumeris (strain AG1-IB / isolate 7/3/14) TaxID=1108050 RepID=A0A0B7FBW6_THACB|nr:hypothetical protein RSOLAG1IB_06543 [Rhizoctonia solani AG-1 IB]
MRMTLPLMSVDRPKEVLSLRILGTVSCRDHTVRALSVCFSLHYLVTSRTVQYKSISTPPPERLVDRTYRVSPRRAPNLVAHHSLPRRVVTTRPH